MQVRPGDRVPCDGEVIDGTSGVDESPVTGESVSSLKEPGAEVFAGSINAEALLRVRVTKAAEDNTIARIVRLIEEAESARAPTERFIDRFSRVYMPAVVGAAVLVAVIPPLAFGLAWGEWIYRALALLLIGCPCALVISVPASITSALSTGARNGMLMKGGAVIEAAARTTHVAFDKTGTLTHGRPRVTDVAALTGDENALMALAAGVEGAASHPLGQAICAEADRRSVDAAAVTGGRALPGKGAEACIDGATVCVGSPRLAEERAALTEDHRTRVAALEAEGKTVVVVLRDDVPQGLVAMRDEPRTDAADAVAELRNLGISSIMLTGDNPRTAQAIADGLGIEHRSGLMPEDKVTAIRDLTTHARVMLVGDGINDAPALAAAHVGVAMGSGTDVALETADAAILRNRVTDVPAKIRLARATMSNIRQ
ncbi:Cd2+/Zn2+-exporting ATPase, partial [Roseivivax marinus]